MSIIVGSALCIGSGIGIYKKIREDAINLKKEKKDFINKWILTMQYSKEGMFNKNEQTYEILEYFKKYYGCDCIVSIPFGLNYEKLCKHIPTLENTFKAKIIIELSTDGNSAYMRLCYNGTKLRDKDNIKFKWYKIMCNNEKLRNQCYDTYKIKDIEEKEYGFSLNVTIPEGLNYDTFESIQHTLESSFGGKVYMKWNQFNGDIKATIVTKELPDDYKFTPVKTSNTQLYLGMTYDYKPVIVDLKSLSHMIYSGMTNTGKTVCMLTALTNLIYWNDEKTFELYLAQISDKKDLRIFSDVKQCKYYADDLEKVLDMLLYLKKEMKRRNDLFNSIKDEFINNIYAWNKKFPHRKLPEIIFAGDEFSYYMKDNLDNKQDGEIKDRCLDILLSLFKEGRNTGIHLNICLQRPDKESLTPRLKSQIGIKVAFYQPNDASSLVVIDSIDAAKIRKQREAIVIADDKYLMKTLFLDESMIRKYISKYIEKDHKYIDLYGENEKETEKSELKGDKNTENSHNDKQNSRTQKYFEQKNNKNGQGKNKISNKLEVVK